MCPLGALLCVCGVLSHFTPVYRCARLVCCFARAASWATWLLFTAVPAGFVVLRVRCSGPLGSCSPVRPLGALLCSCGVLGHLAPVHWCARSVCCVACAVAWATWLLFTDVPAQCVVLCVLCPWPPGSCSQVCPLGVLCYVACAVSWASWLLFTGVRARSLALLVRCPLPLGSCSPVCPLGVLCCVCSVMGHSAPVHQCARLVRCFACAVSSAPWLLFTGVRAWCVVLLVWCPGPLGSCSRVCPLAVLCRVCGVLSHLAPVHRSARSVCCVACTVSWAPLLLFTDVPTRCVVSRVRCPVPLGSCSPVCPLGVLCCLSGVLGPLAPVHWCARSVCCVPCAVSFATWLLFTGPPARRVVLRVRCPGPLGSCPLVCPLGVLCFVYGVLGPLAPVHRCACSVVCVACAVSWATWLLFTGVPARCVMLCVRCPGPLAPVHRCAPLVGCVACAMSWATWLLFTGVLPRCVVLCCVYSVLGPLAPVHWCARSVRRVGCAVSWAAWLLFTDVLARCAALWVACAGHRCGALTRTFRRQLFRSRQGLGTLRAHTRPS